MKKLDLTFNMAKEPNTEEIGAINEIAELLRIEFSYEDEVGLDVLELGADGKIQTVYICGKDGVIPLEIDEETEEAVVKAKFQQHVLENKLDELIKIATPAEA